MAKSMTGANSANNIPTLNCEGQLYETPRDKAELLAKTIAATSADKNYSEEFKQHRKEMEEKWHADKSSDEPSESADFDKINQNFAIHELQESIRICKNGSAPGQDDISYDLLKHLSKNALHLLLQFYNKLWNEEKIIPDWKNSIILPFHKQGTDRTLPTSYRPISLTSALCKINERLITTRLIYYLESKNTLNKYQSAYRKNRSTLDHLIRLHDEAYKNIRNGASTIAIFFDYSKAFDMLWKQGLLHKLTKIGIKGKLKNWIEDFLTDRFFQVNIGGTLSDKYELQNGTPQGSVISPILFLIMINDYPTTVRGTETSLFADDSAIWRSGKNIANIEKQLQEDVDKISKWSSLWGFKLNEKKTVAIIFSRSSKNRKHKLNIKENGKIISTSTTVKFLGIIFDQQLTWKDHINNITNSCKKKINLLRNLSGQQWGAGKQCMLRIYRTLIRPKLEYGIELFCTANKASWRKLSVIQNTCLRLACGAMRGTAIDALQQECGELPILLRRKRAVLRYAAKISGSSGNPAISVLQDCWQLHYSTYPRGKEPMKLQTNCFLTQINLTSMTLNAREPWKNSTLHTDKSLLEDYHKQDRSPIALTYILDYIKGHENKIHIYTDASARQNGQVGAAYYIPEKEVEGEMRLTDDTSITTAELVAIHAALKFVSTTAIQNTDVLILTDSLAGIRLLEQGGLRVKDIASEILDEIECLNSLQNIQICFLWIPSHIGIPGNKQADSIARKAAGKYEPDTIITPTLKEAQNKIDNLIDEEWQQKYSNSSTAKHYKTIEPTVTRNIKFTCANRRKETFITRLRLGCCGLNLYLRKIGKHQNGLCDSCNLPESVEHFLLNCPSSNIFYNSNINTIQKALYLQNIDMIYEKAKKLRRYI